MERISKIREKLRGLTPQEIVAEAVARTRRQFAREISRALDQPEGSYVSDRELDRQLGGARLADVAAQIRTRAEPHLTAGLADIKTTAEAVKQFFPESVDETRRQAEQILSHRVTIFESVRDLGPQIDWHSDPVTNVRWPVGHFTRVPLRVGQGADVRAVWELNRLHHLTALGRAYALTGDERYTEEFLLQIAYWYEENPPRFGVNWTVAMEAAIRAVNLIAAVEMFRSSPMLIDEAVELVLKILIAHGRFIRANLEHSRRAPSNHYLSDLLGLFVIGMTFPQLGHSREWVSYSAPRLLKELDRQTLADGVNYEGSTGYHRLALEIFTTFFALSHASGIELPGESWERLEAMFNFTRCYLKPDGTAPLVGDSDDGRVLKFKERPALDHSYLMSIAAVLIESDVFKQSNRIDEEAIWWFGAEGREAFDSLPVSDRPPASQAFAQAQVFIQRDDSLYAIIDCGDHGVRGHGSHAHSDALSVEVFAFGQTFLRDPGTFAYTASERWRNLFRSTAYHNTVRVDGEEISRITEGQLFALGPNVRPRVNEWESTPERDRLDAEHYGYTRLEQPVTHRRIVTFDKRERYWVIEDVFTGEGSHQYEFFFNFDAGLDVRIEGGDRAVARGKASGLAVVPVSGHTFEAKLTSRWVSTAYGTRRRSSGIIYRLYAAALKNVMLLVPFKHGDEARVKRLAP